MSLMGDAKSRNLAVSALNNTQEALNAAGYGDLIKATLPQPYLILKENITKPSEAEFKDEIKQELLRFLTIIKANDAPFCLEIFPIDTIIRLNVTDPGFGFPDNKSTHVITDVNGAVYTNVFVFAYDAFAWALEKSGFPDLKIVVSHVGWPTDGYPGANVTNAERFYKTLLPLVASGKGTPKRPGSPIDTFVHALTDENKNPAFLPYGRHWGIYRSNGEPKYKIDLTGQGRDVFPAKAKGIMQMPQRWCVVDKVEEAGNEKKMEVEHEQACEKADCTSTYAGGSCSGLNHTQNVSYAFNMLFQNMFQDEGECYFHGLARVVTDNPSTGGCVFPVEVVKGVQDNYVGDGNRTHEMPGFAGAFVILLSTLWALFHN
ncbi:glucan endo-1 3-beta-glucosidase 8 [Phtheirospermum japonicum]|uniref:Glucan endo-1 3-beta-glucosidase 8 n=1 Tax=Phtheirospermum japonicum TaxID=374723 RepID=A0A830C3S9_9LAMI|nr:glucan endo-1 3-beta-glucosidase 8 [Phtheirospermum japonicum]